MWKIVLPILEIMGAFRSTKYSENFETGAMERYFLGKFPENPETVELAQYEPCNCDSQLISGNPRSKLEWSINFRKKLSKKLGIS